MAIILSNLNRFSKLFFQRLYRPTLSGRILYAICEFALVILNMVISGSLNFKLLYLLHHIRYFHSVMCQHMPGVVGSIIIFLLQLFQRMPGEKNLKAG